MFNEILTHAKMVGRDEEEALANLAAGGIGGLMMQQDMPMPMGGAVQRTGLGMMDGNDIEREEKMATDEGAGQMTATMTMMNDNDNDAVMTLNASNHEQTTHDGFSVLQDEGDGSMELD